MERGTDDHFTMPSASTTEVTRSKISDLAGRTEEVLLLLVKDNEDLRWVGSVVVLRCILGVNYDKADGNVEEISLSNIRSLLEKETRERAAEVAEISDKFAKENADLRERLGKEVAGREADVQALQARRNLVKEPLLMLTYTHVVQ